MQFHCKPRSCFTFHCILELQIPLCHVLVSLNLPVAFKMWQGKVIFTAREKEEGTGQQAAHPSKYCPLQYSLQKHPLATEQIHLHFTCRLSSFRGCSEPASNGAFDFFLCSAVCFLFYETGCLIPGVLSWLLRLPRLGTPTRQQRQRYFTPADYLVQSAEKSILLFPNKARDNRWKTAFLPVNASTGISNLWELRRHLANVYFLRAQALFLLSLEMHLCCWCS